MNFLAHLLLSDGFGPLMVGNFMGDFVKGKQLESYSEDIQKGIRLHRSIDHYTDHHPTVQRTKDRLRPRYRHYAGVVSDMFYDHYLAVHWSSYGPGTLEDFSDKAYQALHAARHQMPQKAQFMLPYMIQHNWLVGYRQIEGIRRALTGMAHRTGFRSGMEHAHEDLQKHYDEFAQEFHEFFPQLTHHSQQIIANKI